MRRGGPSNVEFIRRINGLGDIEAVKRMIFDASYLVLGLGDVYLGAPGGDAARSPPPAGDDENTIPLAPGRRRMRSASAAPICAFMAWRGRAATSCSAGRSRCGTRGGRRRCSRGARPGCLRFFDQIRFYPVSADELLDARARFPQGDYPIVIEETTFDLAGYQTFLAEHAEGIAAFRVTPASGVRSRARALAGQGPRQHGDGDRGRRRAG